MLKTMIKNRTDYLLYLKQDAISLGKKKSRPSFIGDDIWKFERLMRLAEYSLTWKGIGKLLSKIIRYRYYRESVRLNYSIPLNVFGPGLAIVHRGPVVVSKFAKIGKNCRIQTMTVIGATNGLKKAPQIGDNVYIGAGAKIIGDIKIADGVAIGAGAVVVKSCIASDVTLGGVPAKQISTNSSQKHIEKSNELQF